MRARRRFTAEGDRQLVIGRAVLAEAAETRRGEGRRFTIEDLRMREVEKVLADRFGRIIPDPEDTDDRPAALGLVRAAALCRPGSGWLSGWCARWAPWIAPEEIAAIERDAAGRKRMLKADAAARLLGVTLEIRTRLGLRTIGACDVPKAERLALAKAKKAAADRERKAAKRRADGRRTLAEISAESLSASKPWLAEGVSRRTWYRRRGTEMSRVDLPSGKMPALISAIPVPRDSERRGGNASQALFESRPEAERMGQRADGEAGGGGVRGPRPRSGSKGRRPLGMAMPHEAEANETGPEVEDAA